jgi:hypothetical protein
MWWVHVVAIAAGMWLLSKQSPLRRARTVQASA